MRDCLTRLGRRWSARPRHQTYSRSLADQPLICRRYLTHWLSRQCSCVIPTLESFGEGTVTYFRSLQLSVSQESNAIISRTTHATQIADQCSDGRSLRNAQSTFQTSWRTLNSTLAGDKTTPA